MSAKQLETKAIVLRNVIYRYPKSIAPVLHIDSWEVEHGELVFIHKVLTSVVIGLMIFYQKTGSRAFF